MDRIGNNRAELEGDNARHLTQVLRVEAGQIYEITDNNKIYLAEVELARKQRVVFRILEALPDPEALAPITLLVALIKFDRIELLLEKATELGVGRIQFFGAERSERGLEQGAEKRLARWRRIVLESSQQSRRVRMPELAAPVSYRDVLKLEATHRLFLDEERTGSPILDAVASISRPSSVALLVGPEGGWTQHEREEARDAGWTVVSLGPQVLRTETAAMAALAVVNSHLYRSSSVEAGNKDVAASS